MHNPTVMFVKVVVVNTPHTDAAQTTSPQPGVTTMKVVVANTPNMAAALITTHQLLVPSTRAACVTPSSLDAVQMELLSQRDLTNKASSKFLLV